MTDGLGEAYEEKQWDVFCENNDLLLENDELKAENTKLRELVADMWEAMCDVSETWAEDVCADRMHELGIEVS